MSIHSKKSKNQKIEYLKAVDELNLIRGSLNDAYSRFDNTTDPYAMDACIFEINALKSKYDCAVRNIKSYFP